MKLILFLAAFLLMLNSCRSPVPVITIQERVQTVTVKDTAAMQALLECDSNNQVLLKSISVASTPNIKHDYKFENGKIEFKIKNLRDSIVYHYRDSVIFVPSITDDGNDYSYLVALLACAVICILLFLRRL